MTIGATEPHSEARSAPRAESDREALLELLDRLVDRLERHVGGEGAAVGEPSALDAPALGRLSSAFELSHFEQWILLLSCGYELDDRVAELCSKVNGDGRGAPTFALSLAALPDPHWSALSPDGPLRHWQLVELMGEGPLAARALQVAEPVLHFVLGLAVSDAALAGLLAACPPEVDLPPSMAATAEELALLWAEHVPTVVQLVGSSRQASLAVATDAADRLGLRLHVLDAAHLTNDALHVDGLARRLERHIVLASSALAVDATEVDEATRPAAHALLTTLSGPFAVIAREQLPVGSRDAVALDVAKPTAAEQRDTWLGAGAPDTVAIRLASQFNVTPSTIRAAAGSAPPGDEAALWAACRARARARMGTLAQRVEPAVDWDDLVLPSPQQDLLDQLVAQARHRVTVYETWGMRRGRTRGLGVSALFTGPSGTGKTSVAEALARELGLDLYRIDLSAVVSKYIGETEKNLRRVFDAAEDGGAVLFFDEADALFGKRSEVRDSHDRYANVEIAYLLQRMEEYRGLAILATNLRDSLDPAFLRRIRFVVEFPFPDAATRAEIWRRSFPSAAPVEALDVERLARLNVSGGSIRNIAVAAAFLAADRGGPISMDDVLRAARGECAKLDQPLGALTAGAGT